MSQQDRDRQTDENLKALGQMLELPRGATSHERASWKSVRPARRIVQMAHFVRFAAAAAVVFAVGSFVYFGSSSSRVEAATILTSLRTGLWDALHIELQGIEADGVAVDGQVEVNFDRAVSMAGLLDGTDDIDVVSAYVRMDVEALEDAEPDMAGLDLSLEGGHSDEATWAFIDLQGLPAEAYEEPAAAMILGFIQGGILVDLNGVIDLDEEGDVEVEIADTVEVAPVENGQGMNVNFTVNGNAAATNDDEDENDNGVNVEIAQAFGLGEEHGAIGELGEAMLRGDAGATELAAFADALEDAADVTVTETQDGFYVLRAENIDADDEDLDNAVIEVGYGEGTGVEWIEISNVGDMGENGRIRVAFTDAPATNHAAIRAEMIDNGVRVFDIGQMMEQFAGE